MPIMIRDWQVERAIDNRRSELTPIPSRAALAGEILRKALGLSKKGSAPSGRRRKRQS